MACVVYENVLFQYEVLLKKMQSLDDMCSLGCVAPDISEVDMKLI